MVSSGNIILVGLGILILGIVAFRGFGSGRDDTLSEDPIKIQTENPQIKSLKNIISEVEGFIKTNFKAPIRTPGLTTGGKTFPCRGPNCLGIFQAKGTRTQFDPISGQRLAVAGSPTFQNITETNFALNQSRIQQGIALKSDFTSFLKDLQGQLNIIQTNSV